jgi:hypothetical protein
MHTRAEIDIVRLMKTLLFSAILVAGCGDSAKPVMCTPSGGPTTGAADTHCGTMAQATDPAACTAMMPDASPGVDAGDTGGSEFGPTLYNTEGDDDDCKYHVKYSATNICENGDIYFTAVVTKKTDNSPLTGATPDLEIFLNDTHPAPNSNQHPVEGPAGTYKIGPVQFDAPGMWTVRFHFFHQCEDFLPTSPHGHAAFYVTVP